MDYDALRRQLMPTFLPELTERTHALERGARELLGGDPGVDRTAVLHRMVREAHTLKGSGGMLGLGVVQHACHALMVLLGALEQGQREATAPVLGLVLAAVEGLHEAAERLADERPLDGGRLDRLRPALEAAAAGAEPDPAAGDAADEGAPESAAAQDEGHATLRVLVADDSTSMRALVEDVLRLDPGVELVMGAANGREAVDGVLASEPDVVVMDVRMPFLDGYEATREIMRRRPTPVLLMSAAIGVEADEVTERAREAGAVASAAKPGVPGEDFRAGCERFISAVRDAARHRLSGRV